MRRLCISLVLVPSMLVAAAPADAKQHRSYLQEAKRGGLQLQVDAAPRTTRSPLSRAHKYTYGRT
jgi:hypothetical protein